MKTILFQIILILILSFYYLQPKLIITYFSTLETVGTMGETLRVKAGEDAIKRVQQGFDKVKMEKQMNGLVVIIVLFESLLDLSFKLFVFHIAHLWNSSQKTTLCTQRLQKQHILRHSRNLHLSDFLNSDLTQQTFLKY